MKILIFLFIFFKFNQANENLKNKNDLMTIENLIELNNQLKTEFFFKSITLNKAQMATIKFNFSSNFKNLIHLFQLNQAQVSIKHLNEITQRSSNYYFIKILNLSSYASNDSNSLNENQEQNLCKSEENRFKYCYLQSSNLSSPEYMLETFSFNLNHSGSFFICLSLLTILNPNLLIFTENMCQNWKTDYFHDDPEHHSFRYKPLFILLMYILCASILIPIAVFEHFTTKSKSKLKIKIKAPSNCDVTDVSSSGLIRNSTASFKKECFNKDLLSPLIERYPETAHVELHLTEMDENLPSELNGEKSNEADHILDSKPWMQKTDSVPDTNSILLPKSNSFESRDSKTIRQSELNLNRILFESNV